MSATTKAKGIIEILRGILTKLNKLSDEQLQALMDNTAKFEYSEKNVKIELTAEAVQEIIDSLRAYENEDAKAYLNNFKVSELITIAKHAGIKLRSKKKDHIIDFLIKGPSVRRVSI